MGHYDRPAWGKLTDRLTIPVDRELKDRIERVKQKKKFNEWVRMKISQSICELEDDGAPEPPAAA